MIELASGNLLTAPVQALVNTVNTEGVMGKGIALQFKQAYPEVFKAYERACRADQVKLGRMDVHDLGGLVGGPRWIINFPTKGHWRAKSRLEDIKAGLADLVAKVQELGIKSIAIPPLGCGNGGLNWRDVRPAIESAFAALPHVRVLMYAPVATPDAKEMPIRTEQPRMTEGRAALLALMSRYLEGLMDPCISLLEIHKLMYFLQEAGEPLKLEFRPYHYGPYASNLRHVLIKLEGHYISGYGDGQDNPLTPIQLEEGAVSEARRFLAGHVGTRQRMERVAELIDGFEDSYGMELLSTVHWVMTHDPQAAESAESTVRAIQGWSGRKQRLLEPTHMQMAWKRLKDFSWDTQANSQTH